MCVADSRGEWDSHRNLLAQINGIYSLLKTRRWESGSAESSETLGKHLFLLPPVYAGFPRTLVFPAVVSFHGHLTKMTVTGFRAHLHPV